MIDLEKRLRHVAHFPKPGVDFIDITPVLQRPDSLRDLVRQMEEAVLGLDFELIVGAESRGFIMGAPLALAMNKGFVPVRKPGKLPYRTLSVEYALEYGQDCLTMHVDAIAPGQQVLIVDDLLATGGTAKASIELVEKAGGVVAGLLFFVELTELKGREALPGGYKVYSVVKTTENPL